jgi:hypothetical protein
MWQDDDDAAFDVWLLGVDAAVLQCVDAVLDLDAGRAAIFAASVAPEAVPEEGSDDQQAAALGRQLDALLDRETARINEMLSLSAPHYLPYQLSRATASINTMIVVGRALLSEPMPAPWALASDFLHACLSDLMRLNAGLAQRNLEHKDAQTLLEQARVGLDTFCGVLRQCTHTGHGPKARHVTNRLITTAETIQVVLQWTRASIDYLFDDCNQPTTHRLPVN